jgi:hypothetical protein
MNRRSEPRFDVYHQAKIVFLDEPQREIEALLTDISGGGMRLVANQDVPEDQMVCIEVGQHLVLAEIRRSAPRGSRFVIGAEKVHTLNLLTLPESMNQQDRLQALVDDYHLRIQFALESSANKDAAAEPELLTKPEELVAPDEEPDDALEPTAIPAELPPVVAESAVPERLQAAVPAETAESDSPQLLSAQPAPVQPAPAEPGPTPAATPALKTTKVEPEPAPASVAEKAEPVLAPPMRSNPAPAVEPPPHLNMSVDVDFGQLRIMLPQTQEIEPLPGEAPLPQKLQVEAPTVLLAAPAAAEAGELSTKALEPIWLAPPPMEEEEWDALRAVALEQQSDPGSELNPRPQSGRRMAAVAGALVSVLALTAFFFGPIRKSAMLWSPFASASEKAAKKTPMDSAKDLVVHVDSVVPPGPDQASDDAPDKAGNKAPDKAPVAGAKPSSATPVAAAAVAASANPPATIPVAPALPSLAHPVSNPPQPAAATQPAPQSGAGSGHLHGASVKATADSWISTCTDGKVMAGRLLPAGSELGIEFSRQAQVVVGNAGGVQIALEGKPLGPLGPEGKTRLVEMTPSGFHVLATGALDGCGKE